MWGLKRYCSADLMLTVITLLIPPLLSLPSPWTDFLIFSASPEITAFERDTEWYPIPGEIVFSHIFKTTPSHLWMPDSTTALQYRSGMSATANIAHPYLSREACHSSVTEIWTALLLCICFLEWSFFYCHLGKRIHTHCASLSAVEIYIFSIINPLKMCFLYKQKFFHKTQSGGNCSVSASFITRSRERTSVAHFYRLMLKTHQPQRPGRWYITSQIATVCRFYLVSREFNPTVCRGK